MAVAIRQSSDIYSSIEYIFKHLNIKPGKRVCIKPNLCGRYPVIPGENSSLDVMSALIEYLHKQGCNISMIHDSLLGSEEDSIHFEDTLRWAGISENKVFDLVNIVNLGHLRLTGVDIRGFKFHLPLEYFSREVDTYINLAKLKSHMETVISFTLKNQMGLASKKDRINMHRTGLDEAIAKLALAIKPDLNILEGYPAMQGNGPHHGKPMRLNMILAGTNMVELDSFACHLLGYDPEQVPHVAYARDIAAGNLINQNEMKQYACYKISGFKQAEKVYKFGRKIHAYPTKSCSRCINAIWQAGKSFKSHPVKYRKLMIKAFLSRDNIRIVFGKDDNFELDTNDKIICIGKCTKDFALKHKTGFMDTCPPDANDVVDYIMDQL